MKTKYTTEAILNMAMRDRPRLSMIKKGRFTGETMTVPVIYGLPRAAAANIADARTVAASSNLVNSKFLVPPTTIYGAVQIGDTVLELSADNQGAFLQNKLEEVDGMLETLGQTWSFFLWQGGVPQGRRSGALSGNVITLTNAEDTYNWQVGDVLVASDATGASGSDALRSGNSAVTAVDREAGTITVADATAIGSFTANDYLFKLGQFQGNTGNTFIGGFSNYITSTSSPATLYSLVRNVEPTFLAGCRLPSALTTGKGTAERLEILLTQMKGVYQVPVRSSYRIWLNPIDWQVLQVEMRSRGVQPMQDNEAKFGFEFLKITGGGVTCKAYADQDCPEGTAFVEDPDTWTWADTGGIKPMLDGDGAYGLQRLTTGSTAGYEAVYRLIGNQVCRGPGHNGRVAL
jgi:hypothetical protein